MLISINVIISKLGGLDYGGNVLVPRRYLIILILFRWLRKRDGRTLRSLGIWDMVIEYRWRTLGIITY